MEWMEGGRWGFWVGFVMPRGNRRKGADGLDGRYGISCFCRAEGKWGKGGWGK